MDGYFAELIRTKGEPIDGRIHLDVLPENANSTVRFNANGSTMGMMLSGLSRGGDPLFSGFWLEADGTVTASVTDPRFDAPMHSFSPGEQQLIKETYFKLPPLGVERTVPQRVEKKDREEKLDAEAGKSVVLRFVEKMKQLVGSGRLESCGDLHDGLALVRRNGKYNYCNAEGQLLASRWFDEASEFKDGRATVTRDGTRAEINTAGIALAVQKIEQTVTNGPKIH